MSGIESSRSPRPTAPRPTERTPSSTKPTVTRTIDEGIDLGSGAIGAGVASATLMLTAAGAAAVIYRKHEAGVVD